MVKEKPWKEPAEPVAFIRYKGVWDMQDLYETMVDWFRKRKYKFHEKIYKHKHPSPFGVERQYTWEATRKETEYVQFIYSIYFHTYDVHDIEVISNGKKKNFTKGRIWMEIKASIVTDFEKRWQESSFYAHLKDFYNKYIIKKSFTHGWAAKLRYELYELHALVKKKLKMESDEYEHAHFVGAHKRI